MTSKTRWCLYCPGVFGNGATFALDSVAQSFQITDFMLPDYTGLQWPADTYSVIGATKVIMIITSKALQVDVDERSYQDFLSERNYS